MGKADRVSALVSRVSGLSGRVAEARGVQPRSWLESHCREGTGRRKESKERLPGEGDSKVLHQEVAGDRIDVWAQQMMVGDGPWECTSAIVPQLWEAIAEGTWCLKEPEIDCMKGSLHWPKAGQILM